MTQCDGHVGVRRSGGDEVAARVDLERAADVDLRGSVHQGQDGRGDEEHVDVVARDAVLGGEADHAVRCPAEGNVTVSSQLDGCVLDEAGVSDE